jgi:hypothetical protein
MRQERQTLCDQRQRRWQMSFLMDSMETCTEKSIVRTAIEIQGFREVESTYDNLKCRSFIVKLCTSAK